MPQPSTANGRTTLLDAIVQRLSLFVCATSLALLQAACGGGNTSTEPATPSTTTATATLGTAGGTLPSADQQFALQLGSGALAGDTSITITKITELSTVPAGYRLVPGTAFRISWSGAGFAAGAGVTLRFKTPVAGAAGTDRRVALGMVPQGDTSVGTLVCPDGQQPQVVSLGGGADGYSSGEVTMCVPVPAGGGGGGGTPSKGPVDVGLIEPIPPTIATQPANVSALVGDLFTFSVTVVSDAATTYQWLRNGTAIPGATSSRYSGSAELADNGSSFSVLVANAYGNVQSDTAVLTVGAGKPKPPAAPVWAPSTSYGDFKTGVDLLLVGAMGEEGLAVWNDNNLLASSEPILQALQLPIRGRPQLLTGPNFHTGYIVYVDDDGTSSCSTFNGNRLRAVALGWDYDYHMGAIFPPSAPFTLYQSGGCIQTFTAAMAPDAAQNNALVFAVTEVSGTQIKVGSGSATHTMTTAADGTQQITWSTTASVGAAMTAASDCGNPLGLNSDSAAGADQAAILNLAAWPPATVASMVWPSRVNNLVQLCASTLSGGTWSTGAVVFEASDLGSNPVVTMDGAGNTLALASTVLDAAAGTYALTAAYLPVGAAKWQAQSFPVGTAPVLPSAAFDDLGNAFVVWRNTASDGSSTVYQTRRIASGAWDPVVAVSPPEAVETRYPRICVGDYRAAMVLFEMNYGLGGPFQVFSRTWGPGGLWSDATLVQDSTANNARFADCPRAPFYNGRIIMPTAWMEYDPTDSTKSRIVMSTTQ